jgi:hypothetical protein
LLVLDKRGAAAAADIMISCSIATSVLLIPDMPKFVGRDPGLLSMRVAKAERAATITGSDTAAELVSVL